MGAQIKSNPSASSGGKPLAPLRLSDAIAIDPPVLLAPMSGVTDPPFRALARRLGAPAVVSEMIASHEAVRESRVTLNRLKAEGEERPRIVQLAGHDPQAVGEAARLCLDLGADVIDLNFGCPAKKVTNKFCGSALMRAPEEAARIMEAAVAAAGPAGVPVTAKMRTGWAADARNAPEFARLAQAAGIAAVTVHGRTREQKYAGAADWAFIGRVKAAIDLPLIANGDVVDAPTLDACLERTGADAAMIGRGAYGRPWIVGQAAAYLRTGLWPADPSPAEIADVASEHYEAMLAHYGRHRGLRHARKHLSWYLKAARGPDGGGVPGAAAIRDELMRLEEPTVVLRTLRAAFARLEDGGRQAAPPDREAA
ncbi:MAG: tRNA dihydrouridine synthase DusB [Marivibrio sp.]|uniref:tRNA dihydrouridine synthase DusB n=1 Tax=Marivibrio sp. TaxID=2039719 RepID=UPI0032EF1760